MHSKTLNKKMQATVMGMINDKLEKFVGEPLNRATCYAIYGEIFSTVSEMVSMIPEMRAVMTNDSVNFISQAYYDLTTINNQELLSDIFTKRVRASDISTRELYLALILFAGTSIAAEIVTTIKKRS